MGSHCSSVVICRASPSQKAAVVGMMKDWELRQAGGAGKGPLAWWRRKRFRLAVRPLPPPYIAPLLYHTPLSLPPELVRGTASSSALRCMRPRLLLIRLCMSSASSAVSPTLLCSPTLNLLA